MLDGGHLRRWGHGLDRANRAAGGLWVDLVLYGCSVLFALATAQASTLASHRAWAAVAAFGYAAATLVALLQLATRRWPGNRLGLALNRPVDRAAVTLVTFGLVTVLPLVLQAIQRASGRGDRAQEEVVVIETAGHRLIDAGTPYLDRTGIAALPGPQRLLGYLPYQPAMALFGVPRSLDGGAHWWSDARIWFALVSVAAVASALWLLWRAGANSATLVRALQVVTVFPLASLTLATGGDDVPVLTLCLLGFALAAATRPLSATHRPLSATNRPPPSDGYLLAGLAMGAAAALKLFAWPLAVVLGLQAWTVGRGSAARYAAATIGVPVVTAIPALSIDSAAMVENVFAFPLGRGLVTSPAASPLPGHLLATSGPIGRATTIVLLVASALGLLVLLLRRPPRTAAQACLIGAAGLLAATALLPATRFGYLLYPAALAVWAPALALAAPTPASRDPRVAPS